MVVVDPAGVTPGVMPITPFAVPLPIYSVALLLLICNRFVLFALILAVIPVIPAALI